MPWTWLDTGFRILSLTGREHSAGKHKQAPIADKGSARIVLALIASMMPSLSVPGYYAHSGQTGPGGHGKREEDTVRATSEIPPLRP